MKILVLGGTKDSREIIKRLLENNYYVIATTASNYGKELIEGNNKLQVIAKKMDNYEMNDLIRKHKISIIVDATHPYAKYVSENAIRAAMESNIKYIRFERESIKNRYKNIREFENYDDVVKYLDNKKENVLITTGSNNLEIFYDNLDSKYLYIRILPTAKVIEKCEKLGALPNKIIAMQGPFTKELNCAIYKQFNIKYMVTKDSGLIGGTIEKIDSAIENNIEVLLINRPKLEYVNKYYSISNMIDVIENLFKDFKFF